MEQGAGSKDDEVRASPVSRLARTVDCVWEEQGAAREQGVGSKESEQWF